MYTVTFLIRSSCVTHVQALLLSGTENWLKTEMRDVYVPLDSRVKVNSKGLLEDA